VSSTLARHRKPPPSSAARSGAASRQRKLSAIVSALRSKPARVAAAAVAGAALLVCAWPTATHWIAQAPNLAWVGQADALGLQAAVSLDGAQASQRAEIVSVGIAVAPGYLNPLRGVSGLVPERIDQGVDFGGSGPVYALGNAVITNATGDSAGWGGGWITYQLTDGPAAGLVVYVAEDVTPAVQVGQHVSPSTVIGNMFAGGEGIETGWAQASGLSAESQLPEAGGIGGNGPFPTMVGADFEALLLLLGAPAAPNSTQPAYGLLPANYPATWG
jgi:murein DD-endopeptidase MepM/ murein hydrolase activator NlpD